MGTLGDNVPKSHSSRYGRYSGRQCTKESLFKTWKVQWETMYQRVTLQDMEGTVGDNVPKSHSSRHGRYSGRQCTKESLKTWKVQWETMNQRVTLQDMEGTVGDYVPKSHSRHGSVGHLCKIVVRTILVIINNIYCIPTYVVWMMMIFPLKKYHPELYWKIEGHLFHWLLAMVSMWSWSAGYNRETQEQGECNWNEKSKKCMWENRVINEWGLKECCLKENPPGHFKRSVLPWFGHVERMSVDRGMKQIFEVVELGDDIRPCLGERTLVIANHQSTADVPLLMAAFNPKKGVLPNIMWIMDHVFKYTNFGIVSILHQDFFIVSGKAKREESLQELVKHLRESYIPLHRHWMVLFPEGGFLRKRRETSQK
uniref:Phospholipid/glycerol acyltransferase domain-containing protein n=1 Tax=Timema shepardi TaxID=629360 RepID=A0A7R9FZI0_TIMSH|nr:unnamed protein product [Timema shepardi]